MKPTTEPTVAPTIMPTLVATVRTHTVSHFPVLCIILCDDKPALKKAAIAWSCYDAVWYVQVTISRLMKQLSEPAVLLAVQMYFPDMLPLRLLSFRVPVFWSKTNM